MNGPIAQLVALTCHGNAYIRGFAPQAEFFPGAERMGVFGGMGSWNDMGFDGDAAKEYEAASAALYAVLCEALCVAANASDAGAPEAGGASAR